MIDLMEEKEVYLVEFSRFEKGLGERAAGWPHALRAQAVERFAELGFPGPRDEDWKFTSLAPLAEVPFKLATGQEGHGLSADDALRTALDLGAPTRLVFVNGRFAPQLSATGALPAGVTVGSLADALEK